MQAWRDSLVEKTFDALCEVDFKSCTISERHDPSEMRYMLSWKNFQIMLCYDRGFCVIRTKCNSKNPEYVGHFATDAKPNAIDLMDHLSMLFDPVRQKTLNKVLAEFQIIGIRIAEGFTRAFVLPDHSTKEQGGLISFLQGNKDLKIASIGAEFYRPLKKLLYTTAHASSSGNIGAGEGLYLLAPCSAHDILRSYKILEEE